MPIKTLLITPPFTQLNTPYPASQYLLGFLQEKGYDCDQCDLSIELFNKVFTRKVISQLFLQAEELTSLDYELVWDQRQRYIDKVDIVIAYLRKQEEMTAEHILNPSFLPKAHRAKKHGEGFDKLDLIDKAKHIGTLFIEELGDFITANCDEFFAFTRYAERIATSASSFDEIDEFLGYETSIIEDELTYLLADKLEEIKPDIVGFSIPRHGSKGDFDICIFSACSGF